MCLRACQVYWRSNYLPRKVNQLLFFFVWVNMNLSMLLSLRMTWLELNSTHAPFTFFDFLRACWIILGHQDKCLLIQCWISVKALPESFFYFSTFRDLKLIVIRTCSSSYNKRTEAKIKFIYLFLWLSLHRMLPLPLDKSTFASSNLMAAIHTQM